MGKWGLEGLSDLPETTAPVGNRAEMTFSTQTATDFRTSAISTTPQRDPILQQDDLGGMLMEEGEVFSKEHGESLGCRVQNVENCSINCGWLELLSCLIAQRLCSFPIHTLKKRCVPLSQPQSTFNMTLQLPQGAFHPMWIGSGRWSHGTQLQKKLRVMLHPFNTWRKPTVLKELAGPRAKPVLFQLDNL